MKHRKPVIDPLDDPTLPKTPIEIDGTTFYLTFDLQSLAEAEAALNREGHQVNLLAALPVLNLSNVRVIFAAALRKCQPEIAYDEAMRMVTLANVYVIANIIAEAWKAALPEPEPVPVEAAAE